MKLYSIKKRVNDKTYIDFYLVWEYNGKVYDVRVSPSFFKSGAFSCMYSTSEKLKDLSELAKLTNKEQVA